MQMGISELRGSGETDRKFMPEDRYVRVIAMAKGSVLGQTIRPMNCVELIASAEAVLMIP